MADPRRAKRNAPPVQLSPEEYAEFIAQIDLDKIWISNAEIHLLGSDARPADADITIRSGSVGWGLCPGGFEAGQTFALSVTADGADAASITVEFHLRYRSDAEMTDAIFQDFHFNLHVNTWPYLRAFVSDMVGRMGWEPITLPVLKIGTVTQSHTDAEQQAESPARTPGRGGAAAKPPRPRKRPKSR